MEVLNFEFSLVIFSFMVSVFNVCVFNALFNPRNVQGSREKGGSGIQGSNGFPTHGFGF